MKSSTKDKVKGTFHQVRGRIKEVTGNLGNKPELEGEGSAEKISGTIQKKLGQIKTVLGK